MPRGRKVVNIGPCIVDGCHTKSVSKGMCQKHYRRKFLYGDTSAVLRSGPKPKPKTKCAAEGCEKEAAARGFCMPHYRRNHKYGDPLGGGTVQGAPLKWIYDNATHAGDNCLLWPFSDLPRYYTIKVLSGYSKAHREMCRAAHGEPPLGQFALHKCNNKSCVNPRHLQWGTPEENMQDAIVAGTFRLGSKSNFAKIDERAALEIRQMRSSGRSFDEIAEAFGISRSNAWAVAERRTWRHIP